MDPWILLNAFMAGSLSECQQSEKDKPVPEVDLDAQFERIIYEIGMAAWGCDLQACLFNPTPLPVPMPPVYGGEPYKMMKIPRPEAT